MAAPFPPQGNQKQQTEKPVKVYGEQYVLDEPIPIGASTVAPSGDTVPPFVVAGGVYYALRVTDWVISNRYTGQPIEVISDDEFRERFGPSTELAE